MFPFADLHGFADNLVIGALDHMHWWLHTVVHIVLVGAPVALLAVLATWCLHGLRRYRHSSLRDAAAVMWLDVDSEDPRYANLYASHKAMVDTVKLQMRSEHALSREGTASLSPELREESQEAE